MGSWPQAVWAALARGRLSSPLQPCPPFRGLSLPRVGLGNSSPLDFSPCSLGPQPPHRHHWVPGRAGCWKWQTLARETTHLGTPIPSAERVQKCLSHLKADTQVEGPGLPLGGPGWSGPAGGKEGPNQEEGCWLGRLGVLPGPRPCGMEGVPSTRGPKQGIQGHSCAPRSLALGPAYSASPLVGQVCGKGSQDRRTWGQV